MVLRNAARLARQRRGLERAARLVDADVLLGDHAWRRTSIGPEKR